jgi:hypothetical protein
MYGKLIGAAATVVLALTLAGLAFGRGTATHQQIAFSYGNGDAAKVALTPLTSGSILADQGSTSWCCWSQKTIEQDGEQLDVNNPLATFVGKRGSLVWREQITWVNLASGYSIATGTWRVVRGSGAYRHLTGHGHVALVMNASSKVLSYRAVGFVGEG